MRDKRGAPRFSFWTEQRIAGVRKGRLPELSDFRPVHCVDLSRSGFAFYQDDAPDYDRLVLALKINNEPAYLVATVKHSWPVVSDGRTMFRVGCEFTGRAVRCPLTGQLTIQEDADLDAPLGVSRS